MKKNGAEVVHLATGMVVGYPPCPHIEAFRRFIPEKYGMEVVVGTHPIPQKYYLTHAELGSWQARGMGARSWSPRWPTSAPAWRTTDDEAAAVQKKSRGGGEHANAPPPRPCVDTRVL